MQSQPKYDINGPRYIGREFFTYSCNILQNGGTSLANGGSANLAINVNGDSDFFWTKFACHANVGNDGTTVQAQELPEVTLSIVNQTNGRYYMSNPVPAADITGDGRLPFILPQVTIFEAKSTVTIAVVNISDNKTYTALYLDFIGIKAYLAQGA